MNKKLKQIDVEKYDITEVEGRKRLLADYNKGMYGGKNVDGEDVMLLVEDGIELHTFQENGWTRVNYYGADGYDEGETFKGRWDRDC